ncbi:MAG: 50S ribosomal protein L24 [Atopobiaceae bacterium]|nr:50S ribosomal protein L24 [Atopobiaceae bacterium]
MPKMNIRKGDLVEVISGKDKGKQGNVMRVIPETNKVVVEGVAIVKKATRPTQANQAGGIVSQEAAVDASTVALVCPKCGKATRVGHGTSADGKVRICKKCGAEF